MKISKLFFSGTFLTFLFLSACSHKSSPTKSNTAAVSTTEVSESVASIPDGEKTYTAKCGSCHKLKDPGNFTLKEWKPIMKSMAVKANLSAEEKANVLAFVGTKAKFF